MEPYEGIRSGKDLKKGRAGFISREPICFGLRTKLLLEERGWLGVPPRWFAVKFHF